MMLTLAILLPFLSNAYAQNLPNKKVLTIGKATNNVIKNQKRLGVIIDYLSSRLSDVGIERGQVILASDNKIETIVNGFKKGEIDITMESPFPSIQLMAKANTIPLVLIERGGKQQNVIVFVRKDSEIHQLEELKGKVLAFQDRGSTSSYFFPKFLITQQGFRFMESSGSRETVPKEKIGYVFAGSEINISSWVFYKKVDAGVLGSRNWNNPKETPKPYRKQFKIIFETKKIPFNGLISVRADLDQKIIARIEEELIGMNKTQEGRDAIKKSGYRITRFSKISEKYSLIIKDMLKIVKTEF